MPTVASTSTCNQVWTDCQMRQVNMRTTVGWCAFMAVWAFSAGSQMQWRCPTDNSKPCVAKCCPLHETVSRDRTCQPTDHRFQPIFFDRWKESLNLTEEDYNFVVGNPCVYERYRLEPWIEDKDEFHILWNGSLRAPHLFKHLLMPGDFCLDTFFISDLGEEDVLPLICFKTPPPPPPSTLQFILYPVGLLISVPFLLTTMLVYCLIRELRDLHGKSLACHVFCLAVAYVFLAAVQLGGQTLNQQMCVAVAFIIQFFFVACFFWLNVLCLDTWWRVMAHVKFHSAGQEETSSRYLLYTLEDHQVQMAKSTERKVFIFYMLYAWGCPILLVVSSVVIELTPTIPSSYLKPNFGVNKCWFSSEEAQLQYFYGPVGTLIIINLILFLMTAWKICRYDWSRAASMRTPQQTFRLCVTLFGVMGINWIMEIVSWAAGGPDYIWYFTDVINTLQGVIIFCIFVVLEPRVRELIRLQLWPWLCKCRSSTINTVPSTRTHSRSFRNVFYSTPEKAKNDMNGV